MTVGIELLRDITAEELLKHFSDLENHPDDALAPYEEYKIDEKTYYFYPRRVSLPQGPAKRSLGRLLLRLPDR